MVYIITFIISLFAATLLPISSEATLLYYLQDGYSAILLFIVSGTGNVLGSVINYWIGSRGTKVILKSQKISKERLLKSEKLFDKYGSYTLLLSWLPIIGDPITLVAGVVNFNFKKFLFIVIFAKFGRYGVIILGYENLI